MRPQYSTVQYNSDELEEIEEIPRMAHTSDNDKPTLNTVIFRAWVKVDPAETFPFPRCVIGSNLAALWGCKIRPYGKPNFSFLLSYPIIIHLRQKTHLARWHTSGLDLDRRSSLSGLQQHRPKSRILK